MPHVEPDPLAASRPGHEYTVRSLYFDTGNLDFYQEKLAGIRDRMKIRIRGYNEISPGSPVFLEIKRKSGASIVKRRASIRYRELSAFLEVSDVAGTFQMLLPGEGSEENARQFLFHLHARSLRPVVSIEYEREALFSKHDPGVRITLDKNLRGKNARGVVSLDQTGWEHHAMPRQVICEIKTDMGIPVWLRLLLRRLELKPEAVSKYTICIDALVEGGEWFTVMRPWAVPNRFARIEIPE